MGRQLTCIVLEAVVGTERPFNQVSEKTLQGFQGFCMSAEEQSEDCGDKVHESDERIPFKRVHEWCGGYFDAKGCRFHIKY